MFSSLDSTPIRRLIHYESIFVLFFFFFFNDTATTEIYTLSLHDALPICGGCKRALNFGGRIAIQHENLAEMGDRKSTRLNSSHANISYAVFCLKKKKYTRALIKINAVLFICA